MKNLNFLTDLRNSNQVMTRLRPGNNQVKTTLRFIAILTMLTLGVGNAWGAVNNGDLFERISAAPAANDEVIIVNSGETVAMSTTQNTNNRGQTSISTSSNQYIYASTDNVQVLTVSINSSKYSFYTVNGSSTGYLQSPSDNNYLKTNATLDNKTKWTISVSSNVFTILNAAQTNRYIAYNSGSSIFSAYKSGQSKPYMYKKVMSAPTAVAANSITSSGATIAITDATNVNNYELYYSKSSTPPTAGSSATTTITGGKSKALTGLDASTTYYVWARAFSTSPARKTGWVALTGSSFSTSAGSCTEPHHVDVGTQWGWFKGETLSLSATAYSTSGSGSPIDAGDITGYQWYKGGTAEGNKIAGATSATYTKASCTLDDAGDYYCKVSTGATCSTMSSAFGVKIYSLECYTGGTTSYNFTRVGSTQTGTVQIDLAANSSYQFKVRQGSSYYGNKGTITEDENTWEFNGNSDHDGNVTVTTYTAGKFTFTLDYSANGASPILAVTYPARTLYLQLCSDWKAASAKYAIYYWRTATGWSEDFMTATACDADVLYTSIPSWAQYVIFGRFNPSKTSTGDWTDKYNQTSNQTLAYNKDYLYSVSGTGDSYSGTWGTYTVPTYTISYAKGTIPTGGGSITGSKADESKTCGTAFTLPSSAVFTTTGYTQDGWATEDGGSKDYNLGGSYTTNAAQAFYPHWSETLHNVTVAYKCGETTVKASTTINNVGIATTGSTTAPDDITGYTWSTWSAMPSGVTTSTTPLTTRAITINATADSKTITANYTANVYNITYKDQGNATYSGDKTAGVPTGAPTTHTYGSATALVNGTKTGYTFGGWYTDASCTVSAGSSIGATAKTADFTLYAKWTATNYSITYNGLEGATNSNPANYTIESSAITLVDPGTRDGYTFAGWYTNEGKTSPVSTPAIAAGSTGNKTFWAKWDRNYYTITWHVGDATDTSEDVEHGTLFSALDPENDAPAHGDGALSACGSTKFIGWVKASGAYTDDGKTVDWYNTHKANASDAITDNTDYYAMYAEAEGAEIYSRVTSDLGATNWAGDYLIAYSSTKFADGRTGGTSGMGANGGAVDPGTKLGTLVDTVNLAWGNTYNVTLELIDNSTNTYVLKTKDNQYNYQSSNNNGLLNTANKATAAAYPISVTFTSSSDIKLALGGGASGAVFRYNTSSSGYFRYYKDGGQSAVYLYKKIQTLINYRTGCSVSCGMPTSLTNTSVGKAGATIGWTGGGNGTLVRYEYAVWEDGTLEPTSGYTSAGTSTSATLTGLYSGVKYNWKVRKVCTGDDNSRFASSSFTTTAADLTFSVPTGVDPIDASTTASNLPEADVPTDCGGCWAFVGWTTAAYEPSSSAPATMFLADTKAKVSGDATLYAVYQNSKYKRISSTDDLVTNNNYVIGQMPSSTMYALSNTPQASYENDAAVTDVTSNMETVGDDKFIKNVGLNNIWKFTGTYSSGQLYNAASGKYLNLTSQDNSVLNTTDNLTFAVSEELWTINSTYYLGGYESPSVGFDAVDAATLASDRNKSYLYRQLSCTFATTPDCPKYTVTWDINNGATTSTTEVTKCAGYLASLPDNPSNTTLSSCQTNGKFMGWSPTTVMPAQDIVPTGMFNDVEYAPEITENVRFYAVFAEEHSGSTGATSRTYTFTSASWGDDASAWTSGAAGNWNSSAVQVTKNKTGANATTISSYNAVTKVTVTYFTNASSGAGSIDIKVNGTSYTGGASVTNSGGTTPRTIDFNPPSSALDGAVKITVTCTDNSIYIKSVQIFYTGSTTTYDQYRTACCNDPQLKFLDGEGDPTTEYVIVREDLASASAGVEIDCDISSQNITGAITWTSTHRDKNDYASAYTWSSSQPANLNIDIANEKITAKETGVWQITISQAAGATTYCPEDATVTVRVKTVDKFIDAVNGNFSGEAQSLEDTGNGILLPTEATFSTDNGCSTTRRLIGWIKASDLATYASGRRVNTIDDLKTADASNKVIAPGTKVQATGITWYAVWGVEK